VPYAPVRMKYGAKTLRYRIVEWIGQVSSSSRNFD
jgi:hypothetical protein